MEAPAEVRQSKPGVAAAAALSKLTPELLLLGLKLLSASTAGKVPCAVVRPRPQPRSPPSSLGSPGSQLKEQQSPPSSPEENQEVPHSGGRKRRRGDSDELTEEQKREKRKLMNRIAAQNARDRKKNYVEDLERRVAELEAKNATLQKENQVLREKTDTLTLENRNLEAQLQSHSSSSQLTPLTLLPGSTLGTEGHTSRSGSAVPFTSLQQKQTLETLFARVMVTVNLILWFTCCKTTPGSTTKTSPPQEDHMIPRETSGASHMTWSRSGVAIRSQSWWGPQQSTWNPIASS